MTVIQKKSVLLIIFLSSFVFFIASLFPEDIDAQSCSGSYRSSPTYDCNYDIVYGYTCVTDSIRDNCDWHDLNPPGVDGCYAEKYYGEDCTASAGGCLVYNRWDGITSSGCSAGPTPTTPPGCTCGGWTSGVCGGGSCPVTQMEVTRSCNPAGCNIESDCVPDASCVSPSCTVTFPPGILTVDAGSNATLTASIVAQNGAVSNVIFNSSNLPVATVSNPWADPPYTTTVTGIAPGNANVTVDVYMEGVLTCGGATPIKNVQVSNPGPWCQIVDGDVTINGDVVCKVPTPCDTSPACDDVFIKPGLGNSPGVLIYAGDYDFDSSLSEQGKVSEAPPWGWKANADYVSVTEYKYAFYNRLIPGNVLRNTISGGTVGVGLLISQSPQTSLDGYKWVFKDGDLTLNRQDNIGANKIILFVAGDLTINGPIRLTPGAGFFMAIVSGNIIIDPMASVAGPELEGIFVTDQSFITAVDNNQLEIRGMVAAYGAVDPNRDLTDNTIVPAEVFEYAPDLLFNYPSSLMLKRTRWKEITP